jgi:hypothetical protein
MVTDHAQEHSAFGGADDPDMESAANVPNVVELPRGSRITRLAATGGHRGNAARFEVRCWIAGARLLQPIRA